MTLIYAVGIMFLIACAIIVLSCAAAAIVAFVTKRKKIGFIFTGLTVFTFLGSIAMFVPGEVDHEKIEARNAERKALLSQLEAEANKAMGGTTTQGDQRVDLVLDHHKEKFEVDVEIISDEGADQSKNNEVVLNDLKLFLKEIFSY